MPPHKTTSSASTVLMRTVDQFRSEHSRTGHVGAKADASYRFPVTSHSPMNVAFTRVRDFATSNIEDLQLLGRNHAVSFSLLSLMLFSTRDTSSSNGCAEAHPVGVVL